MYWSKVVRRMLKIEVVEHVMEEELRGVICSAFGVSGFEYSVFEGTPSVHQKTTIQVWKGERILGYVKVTRSEKVGMLFEREASFLKYVNSQQSTVNITPFGRDFCSAQHSTSKLDSAFAYRKKSTVNGQRSTEKSRRDDIPQTGVPKLRVSECNEIYFGCQAGAIWTESTPSRGITPTINPEGVTESLPSAVALRLESGSWILIQSTRKTLRSKVVHEWVALQENFLKRLYVATAKEILWEESDVAQALRDLREHVDWLPDGVDGDVVARRIDAVMERMAGKRVMYGAYHGDFTPWNMFVEGGELFVFDWEYAGWTYPMGLDRYHFWMQTAMFEKHWGVEELKRYMGSEEGKWIDREMLEMYVLDVMSKYVMREGGKVKELGLFGVWGGMVKGK